MKIEKWFKSKLHQRLMLILAASFLMVQGAYAQELVTIKGVVKDSKTNELLTGVTVAVVGDATLGTYTMDGAFELDVPSLNSMIEFSYMGYIIQEVKASLDMNISLTEDVIVIDPGAEVVAVGMGTARRDDLTGAISSVAAEDLRVGVTSTDQALQGKIAGLSVVQGSGDPTQGAQLRLRGGSSLSGNNSPLVVVDGIAGVDLNTIPAADILTIDVLKDASAAAIYGSRAANGVILVTTKRKDRESQSVNYSGYVGIAQASDKLDVMDAQQWSEERDPALQHGADTDWQDEVMRTALTQSHALSFSNISQKGGVKGSISYLNAEGVVETSKLERLGASVSGFTNILDDYVTLELGLSKTQDNYRDINGAAADQKRRRFFTTVYQANPTWPVYAEDGSLYRDPNEPLELNPYNYLKNHFDDRTRDLFMGYLKADVWFIKGADNEGLKGTINLGYNSTDTHERRYVTTKAQETLQTIDGMRGSAVQTLGKYAQQQIEMYLNWDKSWNAKIHRLNLMAGYSYAKEEGEGFGVGVRHFDFDNFLYNALDAAKNFPMINGMPNYSATSGAEYAYSYKDESKLSSFFGRVNYSFKSRYMFTATLRADGASKFGPNYKWGYFPSASFAWRVSQESFMQNENLQKWLSDLKLRVGYGVTGNQGGIGSYTSIYTYAPSNPKAIGTPVTDASGTVIRAPWLVYSAARNENPDLKWEATGQFNAGLDFDLWNSRLTGTFEFYHKKTTDLLYFYNVGAIEPLPYTLMNIGELQNMGVELSLNGVIMKKDNFTWMANLNLAHNKNEFLGFVDPRFEDGVNLNMGLVQGPNGPYDGLAGAAGYSQKLKPGYSIGSFFGAKTAGLDENGQILFVKGDGNTTTVIDELSPEDRDQYLGCAMPKLNMSFGMNFNIKRFEVGVNTNGSFGQKVYNATAMVLSNVQEKKNVLASSLDKNTGNIISDYWLEDASFFRIQSITLGYNFNVEKLPINGLRLYATIDNPIVFTSYSGVDPEVSLDMNVTTMNETEKRSPGIDNFDNYPKPRTIIFGVNIQF